MLKLENHLGVIEISEEYFANLIGHAVSECFGVAGMVSSGAVQGLRSALSKEEFLDKGVAVKAVNGKLVVTCISQSPMGSTSPPSSAASWAGCAMSPKRPPASRSPRSMSSWIR